MAHRFTQNHAFRTLRLAEMGMPRCAVGAVVVVVVAVERGERGADLESKDKGLASGIEEPEDAGEDRDDADDRCSSRVLLLLICCMGGWRRPSKVWDWRGVYAAAMWALHDGGGGAE